jgi:hypothetical protein
VGQVGLVGWILWLALAAQPTGTIRGLVIDTKDGTGIRSVSVRIVERSKRPAFTSR